MSVDLLYESMCGVGIDPGNSANVLDLAAVGATFLLWRCSPVEGWHYRIVQSEMMRANAATTRAVRECALSPLSPWTTSAEEGQDARAARRVFAAVGQVVADAQRRLPDGRTLAAWASSQEELAALEQHVRLRVRCWTLFAGQAGLGSVLVLLALVGGASCRQWWLMPWWPDRGVRFVQRCRAPARWEDPQIAAAVRALGAPPDTGGFSGLETRLLAGPDTLTAAGAEYCVRAGLSHIRHPLLRPGTLRARHHAVCLLEPETPALWRRQAQDALLRGPDRQVAVA